MWAKVPTNELYEVNEIGEVRESGSNRPLSQFTDKDGYSSVTFNRGTDKGQKSVHRLVAETFIPNPNGLPEINHKDENKQNNSVGNLEWCERTYNNNYGTRTMRSAMSNMNPLLTNKAMMMR